MKIRIITVRAILVCLISFAIGVIVTVAGATQLQRAQEELPIGAIFRVEECPELCDYPDIQDGRVVYEDHRGAGIEIYGWDLTTNNEFMVTHDGPHQHFPVIHGNVIAYTDLRYSSEGLNGTDVLATDLSTAEEFLVTDAPGQQIRLAIGERYIVWEDDRDGDTGSQNDSNRDIYGYDLLTGEEMAIATGPAAQVEPDVSGSIAVWSEDRQIRGRDLISGDNFIVPSAGMAGSRPVIAGDLVVWEAYVWDKGVQHADLYAYRLSTDEIFPLVEAPGNQQFADISEELVVWQDDRQGNWEIYAYDLGTASEFPVTQNGRKQKWPAVDGSIIVWSDFRELQPQIYGFIYDGEPPLGTAYEIEDNPSALVVGALPGGEIRLTWRDNTEEETQYVIERNEGGMLGTGCQVVAVLPADQEAYVDYDNEVHTPYWYRVYALNQRGRSSTTNESYNVALPAEPYPNEQERYMQVLINEVRADPGAFGYPSYDAQPPLAYHANLNYAARAHAIVSVLPGGSGGHVDWADRGAGERALASGFDHTFVSENMATYGGNSAEEVEASNLGFLSSNAGHRDNMLVEGAVEVGIGYYFDETAQQGSWVETFAGREGLSLPYLPAGSVEPFWGAPGEQFTYVVNYFHPQDLAPNLAQVVVDGAAHELALRTGTPGNGTYTAEITLQGSSEHRYFFQFAFADGSARLPEAGTYFGPKTGNGQDSVASETVKSAILERNVAGEADFVLPTGALDVTMNLPVIFNSATTCGSW